MNTITQSTLQAFRSHLITQEKSPATVDKYCADARQFAAHLGANPLCKEALISYKQQLTADYAPRSANSKIASLNSLATFLGRPDCRVKSLKIQPAAYAPASTQLSRAEYSRLVSAAGAHTRLGLIIQTVCSTGIRVSELKFFTVESLRRGTVTVQCKGKSRVVIVPAALRALLSAYVKQQKIRSGVIFRTRTGAPLDRTSIWRQMKSLCARAGVSSAKVFPHNLRKLFARSFYAVRPDLSKLADVLGHSSVNTTRIYICSTPAEHTRLINKMRLVL